MNDLKGKTALITGGTSGIGRETALTLARLGVHIVLTGRREKEGDAVAKAATALGVKALFVQGDVTNEADAIRFVKQAVGLTGKLNFAFNNAGFEGDKGVPTHQQTAENYRKVFDINVLGVLLGMKHQIPALLASGGGSIVNNASIAGSVGMAGMSVYVASKHAVVGLTRSAALEYAKQGIRINAVSPAGIHTEMLERFGGGPESEANKQMGAAHPVGRLGSAAEVAGPVAFLFSDTSSFMTGHDLLVDGGWTAQ